MCEPLLLQNSACDRCGGVVRWSHPRCPSGNFPSDLFRLHSFKSPQVIVQKIVTATISNHRARDLALATGKTFFFMVAAFAGSVPAHTTIAHFSSSHSVCVQTSLRSQTCTPAAPTIAGNDTYAGVHPETQNEDFHEPLHRYELPGG